LCAFFVQKNGPVNGPLFRLICWKAQNSSQSCAAALAAAACPPPPKARASVLPSARAPEVAGRCSAAEAITGRAAAPVPRRNCAIRLLSAAASVASEWLAAVCSARLGDQRLDLLGGIGRALGEFAHFLRDDGKALAGLAGARRLDAGIERQKVGLEGDLVDDADDVG
jgi:hypothetical protein